MKTIKVLSIILLCIFVVGNSSCHIEPVERQTSVTGVVQLKTGELAVNYPLTLSSYKASLYGRGLEKTVEELKTNQQGKFTYSGSLITGLSYSLSSATIFYMNGRGHSLETIQSVSSGSSNQLENPIRISPGQQYQLKIILSN